jgi:basic membrane lipoprotein Med (substrate-binding protein (PBP1-ABC) superfamily)
MATNRNNLPRRTRTDSPPFLQRTVAHVSTAAHSRPKTLAAVALGALAAVSVLIVLLLPSQPSRYQPPIRARQYSAYTACLLTDSQGITSPAAKPVWAAMQAASTATSAQISYLSIQGATSATNADTLLNTLALRSCNLIVSVGELPGQAVRDRATAYPKQHFTVVDDADAGSLPSNASTATAGNVKAVVEASYTSWKNS